MVAAAKGRVRRDAYRPTHPSFSPFLPFPFRFCFPRFFCLIDPVTHEVVATMIVGDTSTSAPCDSENSSLTDAEWNKVSSFLPRFLFPSLRLISPFPFPLSSARYDPKSQAFYFRLDDGDQPHLNLLFEADSGSQRVVLGELNLNLAEYLSSPARVRSISFLDIALSLSEIGIVFPDVKVEK